MNDGTTDAGVGDGAESEVSVDALRQELESRATNTTETSQREPAGPPERLVEDATRTVGAGRRFRFDEDRVKQGLDELLVALVGLREQDTHGKGLMWDLTELFDARLSPGTVYPRLHALEEEGYLESHELVRTKEYGLDDRDAAASEVARAGEQFLALGMFLQSAAQEL
jgi:hypothetical protein